MIHRAAACFFLLTQDQTGWRHWMREKEEPTPATITELTNRYRKYHQCNIQYMLHFAKLVVHICMFTRSKWVWSLKPVPGHKRPQPRLGIRWNSQRPTWCFEVTFFLMSCLMKNNSESIQRRFSVCVSRYDKQSVYNRRRVGEAPDPAPGHLDHGCLCESQRWQAASGARCQCGIILH